MTVSNPEPHKVLIIDDDAGFRRILELRVKSILGSIQLTTFDTIASARATLQREPRPRFDLVLLDQHLPDGRGLELLQAGIFEGMAVLAMSSDDAPEIPGATVQAGATFFLNKLHVSEPLFKPLVLGIIERNRLGAELAKVRLDAARLDTVKTLVGTLRHEINNPLGAVLGAAYLLRNDAQASTDQKEAAALVESSGKRIKHVLEELCRAVSLDTVNKGSQRVFHIPGDAPWGSDVDENKD